MRTCSCSEARSGETERSDFERETLARFRGEHERTSVQADADSSLELSLELSCKEESLKLLHSE